MSVVQPALSPVATDATDPRDIIAFQGEAGAYSHLSCRAAWPQMAVLPCPTFEHAIAAVHEGRARYAMIPTDNSLAGRVADIHHLLPNSGLHIIGEHFEPVHHHLLVLPGVQAGDLKLVRSHVHALGQCRKITAELGIRSEVAQDTAGAARELAQWGAEGRPESRWTAAIASALAGEIYGLVSLRANIEDAPHNTTRFVVMASEREVPSPLAEGGVMTSFVFQVRNIPAALYKALGGFATNGVNMYKLESYIVGGDFVAARFYAEVEGHPEQENLKRAFDELGYFSHDVKILGIYPRHPLRDEFTR